MRLNNLKNISHKYYFDNETCRLIITNHPDETQKAGPGYPWLMITIINPNIYIYIYIYVV